MARHPFSRLAGRGVRVAIVDSGLDTSRPDLARNVAGGVSIQVDDDGTIRRLDGYDDDAGHGTACAGIVRGLAPEAELSIIRIFGATLSVQPPRPWRPPWSTRARPGPTSSTPASASPTPRSPAGSGTSAGACTAPASASSPPSRATASTAFRRSSRR